MACCTRCPVGACRAVRAEQICLQVAARHGLCQLNPKSMSLAEILRSHMEEPASLFNERWVSVQTSPST